MTRKNINSPTEEPEKKSTTTCIIMALRMQFASYAYKFITPISFIKLLF